MATKLFLRSTQNNGIGSTYFDMVTTAGSATATGVVSTVASGTEIQWTQTAGGSVLQFVSGRVPAGGFTLTSTDISIWAQESNGQANCGGRYRVFKRTSGGTETELGGGPFDDGVEFGTSAAERTWTGNVTDTAFAEDDRILLKIYITNVGTMGGSRTCTVTYNGADTATGDSFLNIAETVTFKAEEVTLQPSLFTNTNTFFSPTEKLTLEPTLHTNTQSFFSPTEKLTLTPSLFTNTNTFFSPTQTFVLSPSLYTNTNTFFSPTQTFVLSPSLYTNTQTFFTPAIVSGDITLTPSLFTNSSTFYGPSITVEAPPWPMSLDFRAGKPGISIKNKRIL